MDTLLPSLMNIRIHCLPHTMASHEKDKRRVATIHKFNSAKTFLFSFSLCDMGLEHVDDCKVFFMNGNIQGRVSIGYSVKNINICI